MIIWERVLPDAQEEREKFKEHNTGRTVKSYFRKNIETWLKKFMRSRRFREKLEVNWKKKITDS